MCLHYLPPSNSYGQNTFGSGEHTLSLLLDAASSNKFCTSISLINLGAEFSHHLNCQWFARSTQHLFDNSLSEFKMLLKCKGVGIPCVELRWDCNRYCQWKHLTSILRLNSDSKFLGRFYGTIFFWSSVLRQLFLLLWYYQLLSFRHACEVWGALLLNSCSTVSWFCRFKGKIHQ